MRLVQIKLNYSSTSPFWFLGRIQLNEKKLISDFLDVDSLEEETKKIIDLSAKTAEIKLFDYYGERVLSLSQLNRVQGDFNVGIEDSIEEISEDLLPEMISVTEEEIEEEEETEEEEIVQEKPIQDAEILLNKNGNTVKKMIKNLPISDDSLSLLHCCLEIEQQGKARASVLSTIQTEIVRSYNG